ncbi:unnamed protein product [Adineta ricciae]|uniref:ubiquitinyl hydrolase 1 n=1 Tax=Adineta ricciae TaxID=249248 RepID=A0A814KP11_ADIRI|nr:unnamed protein product [Adineta ricciae]CAF1242314.1 unnamed protein product [Adineta ricciae]
MAPSLTEEAQLLSYKFEDADDCVIVHLYANGAVEIKEVDVNCDSDALEVMTPSGQKWKFQLYAHIYADQVEIDSKINASRTQTIIEIRLRKQQTEIKWPQLCSRQTASVVPKENNANIATASPQINSASEQEAPKEISFKKLHSTFIETNDDRVISRLDIKQAFNCQAEFTDTNFTVIFQTNDEDFLRSHSIESTKKIKLFVRVKERIRPHRCTCVVTPICIEITLIKDNAYGMKWNQLEPNEFSSVLSHPLGSAKSTLTDDIHRAPIIALPPIRTSETYSSISTLSRKDLTSLSSTTSTIGFTGIYNPANSCFMNAVVQCLANTRELRDYFLQAYYCLEINRTNALGMKGIMAEEFANVVKKLWSGAYNYIDANQLREYAGKRHQEFAGNGQHDAQEYLTVLLDSLHEDLNRILNKPQVPPVEDENRPDHEVADEAWRGYLSRNDSLIVQLFTGQFKSKTKCPQCHKESTTFDPFTSLSVPLPKQIAVDAVVIFRSEERAPIKYRITMSSDGTIADLKRLLFNKCGLPIAKMLAYKIQDNSTAEHLSNEMYVPTGGYSWNNSDVIYITEILTSTECDDEPIVTLTFFQRVFKTTDYVLPCAYCQAVHNPHITPKYCKNCYQASYCDEQCLRLHKSEHEHQCKHRASNTYETMGIPFVISVPKSKLTCEYIFEQISLYAKRYVNIHIERTKETPRSTEIHTDFDDYETVNDNDDDSFSDIENVDWPTIKSTLSSSDSWSICRIGDYFVKTNKNKNRHNQERKRKEKLAKNISTIEKEDEEPMIVSDDSGSHSSTDDFDMLDDIIGNQPLFRLIPQTASLSGNNLQSIIEPGEDADYILRCYSTFSIDWFTDNKMDAPLRITLPLNRDRINGLVEDDSVFNSTGGEQDITLQQCLELFIKPEVLGPDDKWYCPRCKEHIQAEKCMSVWRLPPILIIHLKRFKYNQYSTSYYMSSTREKIDTTVKFPIHNLDMTPYCASVSEDSSDTTQSRYDLYGVVNHRGSAWQEIILEFHTNMNLSLGWRQFDDTRVSPLANVKDLIRSDAYVLLYRHRHLKVNFAVQEQVQRILTESTLV